MAKSVRWSWSIKRALKEFHLTLYQPNIQIKFENINGNENFNHRDPVTNNVINELSTFRSYRSALFSRLSGLSLAMLQWLRIHVTLIDAKCSIISPTSKFTAAIGVIRLQSACSDCFDGQRELWSIDLNVSEFQLFVATNSSSSFIDKSLVSMQPLDVKFSIPLIRPSRSLPALPSTAETQLEIQWNELKASLDIEQAMTITSLISMTFNAINTVKQKKPQIYVASNSSNIEEWFAPFLRFPSLVDIKLAAFDISLTPAVINNNTNFSKRHTLTGLQLTFSTFEIYHRRELVNNQFLNSIAPTSLPIRATLLASEVLATTHLPLNPALELTATIDNSVEISPKQQTPSPSAQSAQLPTFPFHLIELSNIGIESHLDLSSLFMVNENHGLNDEDENLLELSISSVHLRAHPVIAQWMELLISVFPASFISNNNRSSSSLSFDHHSPRPSRPFFSFDTPMIVPSLPLRVLLEAERVSLGIYRQDGSPEFLMPMSILLITANSSKQFSRYEALVKAQSISLHCFDLKQSNINFNDLNDHNSRHCVIGIKNGSMPLSIVNAHNSINPLVVSHLEINVQPRCDHLQIQYHTNAVNNFIQMFDEFLFPHQNIMKMIESRLQLRHTNNTPILITNQVKLPVIITFGVTLKTARLMIPVDSDDGFHALIFDLNYFDGRHCFDLRNPRLMIVDRSQSQASINSINLKLQSPYQKYQKQNNSMIDCVSLGNIEIAGLPRSAANPLDSVAIKINGAGFAWSLMTQMSWFFIKQSIRTNIRALKQNQRISSIFTLFSSSSPFNSPRSSPRSRSSSSSLSTIILVHIEQFALELAFTEYQSSNPSNRSLLTPHTSLMTFFTSRLKYSSPCANFLSKSPIHPDCKYSLPVAVSPGWWAVDGVPMLHWDYARLGGGRGLSGLPDFAGEMTRGIFRLVNGFNFGASIQSMIDRWKAFKYWRKCQRIKFAESLGIEPDSEQEKHRAQSSHYPYATDFDLGCLHIRLIQCKFELCDSPQSVLSLSLRRASLSADHAIAEADLRRLGGWREAATTENFELSSTGSRSGNIPSSRHHRSSVNNNNNNYSGGQIPDSSGHSKPPIAKSRSLNFDDDRQQIPKRKQTISQQSVSMINIDASNANSLIQSILIRAHGSPILSFPPSSQFPVTAALFSIVSPEVSFSVDYTESLQKMSYLYRKVRSLDPCIEPPYQSFIQAEERANKKNTGNESNSAPDIANSFADLWGRHVILHGQHVEMICRDHPLPLIRAKKLTFAGELILGQLRAPDRWLIQQSTVLTDFPLTFPRGSAIPTKLYYDLQWDGGELDVNWGPALAPCLSAMAEAFNRLTPPATPRVGSPLAWWDDMRYKFHGRLLIVAHETINVRILKTPSPYRANFLLMSATSAQLLHSNGLFDGHGKNVAFDIFCDNHESLFDNRQIMPDYVRGRLIYSPLLHVRVELVWSIKSLIDGTVRNMFDHYVHHYHWNGPDKDCLEYYRARGLQYKCVKVRLEPDNRSKHPNEAPNNISNNIDTSPRPIQKNPQTSSPPFNLHHSASYSTLNIPTSVDRHFRPHLSCRFYAYQYFWALIAIFQDPPIHLSPLATRTRPGLGDMFEHLSLSVLLIEPRIEILDEDASSNNVNGVNINGLLIQAAQIGVDWMWMANYGKDGTKSFESQDMAMDAHRLSMKVIAPNDDEINNQSNTDNRENDNDEENEKIIARIKRAVKNQLDRRVEGEIVNFLDSDGQFHSPFDRPPNDYHVASILSTRLAAYRTYYKPQSSTASSSSSLGKVQPRLTQLEASSDLGRSDRPPFCMDVQVEGERPEWQSLFGAELSPNDESDPVSDIWKGPTQSQADESIFASPPPSPSASDNIDDDNENALNSFGDLDDEEYQRIHTFSLSEFSEASGIASELNKFVLPSNEQSKATNTASKVHRRTRSDTRGLKLDGVTFFPSPSIIQTQNTLNTQTTNSSTIRSTSTTNGSNSLTQQFYSSSSSHPFEFGIDMTIGATRGRKLPSTQLLDLSSTSHNFVCANLKLLCTKSMKHAWLTWKAILSRPYQPPTFVAESQAAAAAYYEDQRNQQQQQQQSSSSSSPSSTSVPLYIRQDSLSVIQEFESPMIHSRSPSVRSSASIDFDSVDPHQFKRSIKDEMMELVYEIDPTVRLNPSIKNTGLNIPSSPINSELDSSRFRHRQIHRWSELSNWFSLYSIDFIRPQINFQSSTTNSRFVLAAARARLESQGLPTALKRDRSSEPITLLPSAEYHLENYVYFARKHVTTLDEAQAFVCPVDIDGEGARVQWAKDTIVMKDKNSSIISEEIISREARLSAALPDSGVLRKIVEPCRLHFTMTLQCDIDTELKSRGFLITDEMNGIAGPLTSKTIKKRGLNQNSSFSPSNSQSLTVARTLSQTIQLFIPSFHAHLDSNEYFTLQSVVEDLFLKDFLTSSPATTTVKTEPKPALPSDKLEAAAVIERALQKDDSEINNTNTGTTNNSAVKCQKRIKRLVQYYLGRSAWELKANNSPFIAANVNGLYGGHTFFHDNSSDTEFSLHFLTLHSKLLPSSDPRANLLIPDPDHWLKRDPKRDQMIQVRAKVHAPLNDSQVKHVTVYELFEVTIFPQVINGSYDDYLALKAYFFPVLTTIDHRNDKDKEQAAKNFFRFHPAKPKNPSGKNETNGTAGDVNRTVTNITPPSSQSQSSVAPLPMSKRASPLSSPLHLSIAPSSDDSKTSGLSPEPAPWMTSTGSSGNSAINQETRSIISHRDRETSRQSTVKTLTTNNRASPARTQSKKLSKPVRKRSSTVSEPHIRYFRYLRVNGVTFLASFRRPHSIWNCENVSVTIAPLIKNQRCWTTDKFYNKLESHLAWAFAHQIPQILARLIGVKGEKGKEVQSLSQRFIDAQIQANENNLMGNNSEFDELNGKKVEFDDERKMLGFPSRAASSLGNISEDQKSDHQHLEIIIPPTPSNSNRTFFKLPSMPTIHMPSMPTMPTMHMPQLSFDGMEELAQKAVLLFGSKKEKNKAEKEKKKKEKERRKEEEKKSRENEIQQFHSQYQQSSAATDSPTSSINNNNNIIYWNGINSPNSAKSSPTSSGSSTPITGVTFTHSVYSPINSQPLPSPTSAPPQPIRPPLPTRPPLHSRASSSVEQSGALNSSTPAAPPVKRTDPAMIALLGKINKKPLPKAPTKTIQANSPTTIISSPVQSTAQSPSPLQSPPPSLPRRPTRYDFNVGVPNAANLPPAPPVLNPQIRSSLKLHARSLSAGII